MMQFNPGFSFRSLLFVLTSPNAGNSKQATSTREWLPAPGSFKGIFSPLYGTSSGGVARMNEFNGYSQNGEQFDYVAYRQKGIAMAEGKASYPVTANSAGVGTAVSPRNIVYADRGLYIRNLSLYEGGHVYSGLTFMGDAKNSLFVQGRFPIVIVEQTTGRVIARTYASATTNWSVPGWVRFGAKFDTVMQSNSSSCAMIFEAGAPTGSNNELLRVAIPVMCN